MFRKRRGPGTFIGAPLNCLWVKGLLKLLTVSKHHFQHEV